MAAIVTIYYVGVQLYYWRFDVAHWDVLALSGWLTVTVGLRVAEALPDRLHTAAKTQIRLPGPGRDYYLRRRGEGKTNAEAIRALKRHITTAVYRTLQADAAARAARRWRRRRTSEADRGRVEMTGNSLA